MEPERWQRIETLFHRSADLPPDERAALLERECGPDADLRTRVEQLLCDDAAGDDPFERLGERAGAGDDPMLGKVVGAYRLVARIAAGGMGVVYRAQRTDGLFEHEVAVKWIRAEHTNPGSVRRFELERRALAALQHPCIARLHDGGTSEDGRPYLVMELVRGVPIDQYCEQKNLPVAERLRLFAQVCRAVHFAHQNLVVHRDLKPSNILIDEHGLPKLLDFGIARLLEDEDVARPPQATLGGQRAFTPEYASPEQLAGGQVTTAIDVYSLGVVLYELLTGRTPFRGESRSPAEWERRVKEHTPLRPSSAVQRSIEGEGPAGAAPGRAQLAARFASTPASLRRRLRGDLDRIVLMALRKEPERRFASAQEFAEDIERHLQGHPVHARPDSLWYRGSKFVQRNRLSVASGAAVLGALVFGYASSRAGERSAREQAEHARIEANSFQSIADFLLDAFLPASMQDEAQQQRVRDRIGMHAERVRRQYPDDGHTRANLLDALGQVYQRLGLFSEAEALLREALQIRAETFGAQGLEYALSLRSLGQLEYARGDYARAAELLREALALNRSCALGTHTDVAALANDLAACLRNAGEGAEAERLHEEALALRREVADGTLPVAESLNNLAGILLDRGEFEPAARRLQEALEIRGAILGPGHPLTLQTISNLAAARWQLAEHDAALALARQAEQGYRELGADGEEGLGLLLSNMAEMQLQLGDLDAAEANLAQALELQSTRLGPDHPQVAVSLTKLANLNHARGRELEAREQWEEVLRIRRLPTATPRELHIALFSFANFLAKTRACAEALPLLEEALAGLQASSPDDLLTQGYVELVLGECLAGTNQQDEARTHLRAAVRLLEQSPDARPADRERARSRLQPLEAEPSAAATTPGPADVPLR